MGCATTSADAARRHGAKNGASSSAASGGGRSRGRTRVCGPLPAAQEKFGHLHRIRASRCPSQRSLQSGSGELESNPLLTRRGNSETESGNPRSLPADRRSARPRWPRSRPLAESSSRATSGAYQVLPGASDRRGVDLARPNADGLHHGSDEDISVSDPIGACREHDRGREVAHHDALRPRPNVSPLAGSRRAARSRPAASSSFRAWPSPRPNPYAAGRPASSASWRSSRCSP